MAKRAGGWEEVGAGLVRGLGGGMIIGIPLLYTMEVWWIGMYVSDWHLAAFLLLTLVINAGLNHAAGFTEEHTLWSDIRDSIIALGAAAVVSAVVLVLINAIPHDYSFSAAVGKIALAAIPVSIGFSVANTHFSGEGRGGAEEEIVNSEDNEARRRAKADVMDIGITIAGATIFVLAVAPTEEVLMIAARTTGWHWVGLVVFSLLITYGIVFIADFAGSSNRQHVGYIQRPIPETLVAYMLAVMTGLALLYLLGRTEVFASLSSLVSHAVVIGLPASIGGAAGRIVA